MTDSVTSLFTFSYSQLCPYTGKDLGDHYALVTAPDRSSARLFMNTSFKRNYAFEYDGPGDRRIVDYVPRMTLHITVNLLPGQPMPPGFEYSRADDGEQPGPVAGRIPPHFEDGRASVQVEPWRRREQVGTAECGCPLYPFPEGRGGVGDEIVDHLDGCRAQEDLA